MVTLATEETTASCSPFLQPAAELHNKIAEQMKMNAAHCAFCQGAHLNHFGANFVDITLQALL
jgi:hypothetical protein